MDLTKSTRLPLPAIQLILKHGGLMVEGRLAQVDKKWREVIKATGNIYRLKQEYPSRLYNVPYSTSGPTRTVGYKAEDCGPLPFTNWTGCPLAVDNSSVVYLQSKSRILAHNLKSDSIETVGAVDSEQLTALKVFDNLLLGLYRNGNIVSWTIPGKAPARPFLVCNKELSGTGGIQVWNCSTGGKLSFARVLPVPRKSHYKQVEIDGFPHVVVYRGKTVSLFDLQSGDETISVELPGYVDFPRKPCTALSESNGELFFLAIYSSQNLAKLSLHSGELKTITPLIARKLLEKMSVYWMHPMTVEGTPLLLSIEGYRGEQGIWDRQIAVWNLSTGKQVRAAKTDIYPDGKIALSKAWGSHFLLGVRSPTNQIGYNYPTGCDLVLIETLQVIRRVDFEVATSITSWISSGVDENGNPWWVTAHNGGLLNLFGQENAFSPEQREATEENLAIGADIESRVTTMRYRRRWMCAKSLVVCAGICTLFVWGVISAARRGSGDSN